MPRIPTPASNQAIKRAWIVFVLFVGSSLSMEWQAALAQPPVLLDSLDVEKLLQRASMATPSEDAIIAVVDRAGRILGVRVEREAEAVFSGRPIWLTFAIDGAVAKARTAAFFSSGQAPLTSRTIRFISQSTITQREVESIPMASNPASVIRGPGFVAPIGVGGHFPPQTANTPLVDLFAIEHQSRDSRIHPGVDGSKGTADDLTLTTRFDANPAHIPAAALSFMQTFPESYGIQTGLTPNASGRGIGTLPGGIGLYKNQTLVGGIGVFFPGTKGFATVEQGFEHASTRGSLGAQTEASRINAPRVLEAEFIAFFASRGVTFGSFTTSVEEFEGVAPRLDAFGGPGGRIDLVGITLEIYGPNPTRTNPVTGPQRLLQVGRSLTGGRGVNSGTNQLVGLGVTALAGVDVPSGWLVLPHASTTDPIAQADVERMINQGIATANQTRAAIRLTSSFRPGAPTRMVFAVTDTTGEVLGLFRMPDATIFSIDVAVAKARNTSYYASSSLVAADRVDQDNNSSPDLPIGTALTNRTIRFLAGPNFPTGALSGPPGDFSILNMPGINRATAENAVAGSPLAGTVYSGATASVLSFDSFNASRNFRDPRNLKRQNGIVFFPGSTPIYKGTTTKVLVGGFGVSGDGVDQDDVVTVAGQVGFEAPKAIRCDNFIISGVRLPFQKFNRNPAL
ncbi:MAG: hypothetical protein SGI77_22930 [Pirellulaceae bacterium]|nr:hypothetical protein [Pirellulaceae bacterium]